MELDDAYANAAHIKGADRFPDAWATKARAFRSALGARAEIGCRYGESERQAYDLFHPEGPRRGTVIFIHGGYWLKFDKSYWSHLAAGCLAREWSVAMPSYDLCPTVSIAEITRQIAQAVQEVANRLTGPLAITGHSAGGHLATRMLDRLVLPEAIAERLTAVAPISPLSDLRPLLKTSMNGDFGLTERDAIDESPIFTEARYPARVSVWVGAEERPAFIDQAGWLAGAWDIETHVVPDRHHFDVIDLLIDPNSSLCGFLTGSG